MAAFDLRLILACPACRGEIRVETEGYTCGACSRLYPLRFGIPDFRLFPDPYIGFEEEVEKVRRILGDGGHNFEQLVDRYYENSPEVSAKLQPRYKQGLKAGSERANNFLKQARKLAPSMEGPILDVGCGTSGLTLLLQRQGFVTVGIDIALRWIVLGRQRLQDAGVNAFLLCANAEALPFQEHAFATAFSDSVLEHTLNPADAAAETLRVLRRGGFLFFNTANRNSLLEAYTGFPLPGLLPESARCRIIEKVCRTPYITKPLSASGLRRLFAGVQDLRIDAFRPLLGSHAAHSGPKKRVVAVYEKLLQSDRGRRFLVKWGFFLAVSGRRP